MGRLERKSTSIPLNFTSQEQLVVPFFHKQETTVLLCLLLRDQGKQWLVIRGNEDNENIQRTT